MFEGFTRTEIATSGARIHLRHGGEGPPLLLLHGKAPLRNPSPLEGEVRRGVAAIASTAEFGALSHPQPRPSPSRGEGAVYVLKNNAIAAI